MTNFYYCVVKKDFICSGEIVIKTATEKKSDSFASDLFMPFNCCETRASNTMGRVREM